MRIRNYSREPQALAEYDNIEACRAQMTLSFWIMSQTNNLGQMSLRLMFSNLVGVYHFSLWKILVAGYRARESTSRARN